VSRKRVPRPLRQLLALNPGAGLSIEPGKHWKVFRGRELILVYPQGAHVVEGFRAKTKTHLRDLGLVVPGDGERPP